MRRRPLVPLLLLVGSLGAIAIAVACACATSPARAATSTSLTTPARPEPPAWLIRRHAWVEARALRRAERWNGTLATLVAAIRSESRAESLYFDALLLGLGSREGVARPADWRDAALDCFAEGRVTLGHALLEGPLRDDAVLRPLRAQAMGNRGAPDSGLALLAWPPDRRATPPTGARPVAAGEARPDEAALLVAGALADSLGLGRVARSARWKLLAGDPSPAARREARLHLGRSLLADGEPRLALELVSAEEGTGADAALLAADARAAARDTLGAASHLASFAINRGAPTADRHAASTRAATWLTGSRCDSLPEPLWLDLLRTLGEIGEAEVGLRLSSGRHRAAPDPAFDLARAEVVASLLARARKNEPASAAYRALLARPGLPPATRAPYALGLGRARRAAGDFAAMDSAFLLASTLDPAGPAGEQAAWERAREWEDRRPPLESASVYGWAKPYLRSTALARSARVHGALAWLRGGVPDSAGAFLGAIPRTDSGEVPFWAGQLAAARGDTTNARADYEAAARNAPWSYEGLRAAEILAAPGGAPGVWPSEGAPFQMEKPADAPGRSGAPARADPPLRARILEALGLTPLALESLRECARDPERNAEASCADALEERGQFRGPRPAGDSIVASRWEYPPAYALEVFTAAARESLPPGLLWAIMRQESGYRRDVRSKARAHGLLQLLTGTASQLAGHTVSEESLYVAEVNVRLGARYVRKLAREFGDPRAVLAAYNAGEDAVRRWVRDRGPVDDRWVELIPYRETRDYVKQVYAAWRRYESLYGTRAR